MSKLRTTVVGSYPLPGWLEFACRHLDQFGEADLRELQEDAVLAAVHDQVDAGLDVITDGEQSRLDFNLSFYGYLDGVALESAPPRRFGPPAHDQRGKHEITGVLGAPRGLGAVEEFQRLQRIAPAGQALKASLPGPFTLSGRLLPNSRYPDRLAITEALLPLVQQELRALLEAGCREICVDEPSMSCYAHKSDPRQFVEIYNRTIAPLRGNCRVGMHVCFGNYKGRAIGPRRLSALFPAFLDAHADEIHVEMAAANYVDLPLIAEIAQHADVAVGIIDVKSYYMETPEDVAAIVRRCLQYAPAERLAFAPDCGLSQTARWAAPEARQSGRWRPTSSR